jgi:hypothetical protein
MSGPTISPAVVATSRDTLAIARIAARKGRAADLTNTVRGRFGIELPNGPKRVQANELAFIGVGVATWLALSECESADNGLDGFAASLRHIVSASRRCWRNSWRWTCIRGFLYPARPPPHSGPTFP